jgi:hypothetical protein
LCSLCVACARTRAMRVGSPSDGPNARMGYTKLTTTERYLLPSQRRTDVARLDRAFSAARPRSRRALAHPPACEARKRPPPARCERKAQRQARGLSVASPGRRSRRCDRRFPQMQEGGGSPSRCQTSAPRPWMAYRRSGWDRNVARRARGVGVAWRRPPCHQHRARDGVPTDRHLCRGFYWCTHAGLYSRSGSASRHSAGVSGRPATLQARRAHDRGRTSHT